MEQTAGNNRIKASMALLTWFYAEYGNTLVRFKWSS